MKAKEIPTDNLPASNLVFLVDVSGSMYGPDRLDLVKSSLKLLVNNLRAEDKVAIAVYSGEAVEKLPSTPGSDKQKIKEAIDELEAEGSTAGGAGIRIAYKIARENFIPSGNNRIILCTDGDFNVGVSSEAELERLIEKERMWGIFLTVLGYGMGNYKDSKMQVLAEKGNGNHGYIDNLQEANRVLVNEFGSFSEQNAISGGERCQLLNFLHTYLTFGSSQTCLATALLNRDFHFLSLQRKERKIHWCNGCSRAAEENPTYNDSTKNRFLLYTVL